MATSPTPSEPKPAASSHDRILLSAKQLFAARGYENTSTVAIARLAGTSESQLMKHFGSKEGLLEAIFDQGWITLAGSLGAIKALPSPRQKLLKLLDVVVEGMERDPELKQLLLLEGRRVRKEGQMVMLTEGFLRFIRLIDDVLAEMRSAGQLRPDINRDALRSALVGMFEGLMRDQLLSAKAGFPSRFTAADLHQIFDVLIPALAPVGK